MRRGQLAGGVAGQRGADDVRARLPGVQAIVEGRDVALVLHTPDPARTYWFGNPPGPDAAAVAATVRAVRESGAPVALADVRHTNGGDPVLIAALRAEGLVDGLVAYRGWNTAGNTIGSVVAAAVATVVGAREHTLDRTAARRLLLHRLTEDYGYQAVVRATGPDAPAARERLQPILHGFDPDWTIEDVTFPGTDPSRSTSRWPDGAARTIAERVADRRSPRQVMDYYHFRRAFPAHRPLQEMT
ncbi:DUF4127 family protein [Nonomuraea angiospora]|uniref:DUF4127 family protein n=1 Tax=Nonomuraea angiospora TaxID=46172 RepID=UPI0029B9E3EA|nr:DUF4127 family protein [Nonomuraea angiospora]MDX3103273.1 DUF4127 family protein [Nonomuraea angiospora]